MVDCLGGPVDAAPPMSLAALPSLSLRILDLSLPALSLSPSSLSPSSSPPSSGFQSATVVWCFVVSLFLFCFLPRVNLRGTYPRLPFPHPPLPCRTALVVNVHSLTGGDANAFLREQQAGASSRAADLTVCGEQVRGWGEELGYNGVQEGGRWTEWS